MDHFMPTRLHTGNGCLERHGDALGALGESCAIVTGRNSARSSGALADTLRALDACGVASFVWDGVTENPPVSACVEAGRLAAERNARFVLGPGGGSALDAAKAVAVFAANPTLDEDGFYAAAWPADPLAIALVGTTAGTGSEVTKVAVLTDLSGRKHSIHDDRLYAAVAFGDSRHTHSCPRPLTLSAGVDVLAHATESYFSRRATEISRAAAVRAVRLALAPLAAAVGGEPTPDQRRQLYEASILGGLAINATGTCFPHNVGYYLTETHGVPHGFASAAFLPALLALAREDDPAYAAAFYAEAGADEAALTEVLRRCLPPLDIRMTADEVTAALPRWEDNGSVNNTRADVSSETVGQILRSMFVE